MDLNEYIERIARRRELERQIAESGIFVFAEEEEPEQTAPDTAEDPWAEAVAEGKIKPKPGMFGPSR